MADVLRPPFSAPLPHLAAEAGIDQLGDAVHVLAADAFGLLSVFIPQSRQVFPEILSPEPAQHGGKLPAPWQTDVCPAREAVKGIARHISDFRLIGEKAGESFAKLALISCVMGLIHLVKENPD